MEARRAQFEEVFHQESLARERRACFRYDRYVLLAVLAIPSGRWRALPAVPLEQVCSHVAVCRKRNSSYPNTKKPQHHKLLGFLY